MKGNYSVEEMAELKARLLANKLRNSVTRGISFNLSIDDLLWPAYCPVLGIELNYSKKGRGAVEDDSATFDRVDPDKGYVKGNVRIISSRANRLKDDGTAEEHRKIAAYIEECIQ